VTTAFARHGLSEPITVVPESGGKPPQAGKEFLMPNNRAASYKAHNPNLNHLRWGVTYRAITASGDATGEYLGVETAHGVWSILLHHDHGTESIPLSRIDAIAAA
jgi:hypothetical protein